MLDRHYSKNVFFQSWMSRGDSVDAGLKLFLGAILKDSTIVCRLGRREMDVGAAHPARGRHRG